MSTLKSSNGKGVDLCLSWINSSGDNIPAGAVSVGDGVYVARCIFENQMTPGKVADGHTSCYAPYGGEEHSVETFQVLCDTCDHNLPGQAYSWTEWSGNTAPRYAVIGGTDSGSPLYVAKAQIEGQWCAGKYAPQNGSAFFAYGGQEHELHDGYQVLVMHKRSM